MRKFNCLDKEIIKEQLKLKSDRTINNNIAKAEEKLLMNREFRRFLLFRGKNRKKFKKTKTLDKI